MTHNSTRRDLLRGGLVLAGLTVLGISEWALPALAQGDVEAFQLRLGRGGAGFSVALETLLLKPGA